MCNFLFLNYVKLFLVPIWKTLLNNVQRRISSSLKLFIFLFIYFHRLWLYAIQTVYLILNILNNKNNLLKLQTSIKHYSEHMLTTQTISTYLAKSITITHHHIDPIFHRHSYRKQDTNIDQTTTHSLTFIFVTTRETCNIGLHVLCRLTNSLNFTPFGQVDAVIAIVFRLQSNTTSNDT